MKLSSPSSSFAIALLLGTLTLVGCGGALNFPDSVATVQAVGPPMSGRAFGGHAPIVGMHVYLAQPGTAGVGSPATPLLGNNGASSAGGYPLTANPSVNGDPYVPAGADYVTTDSSGAFSLTGAYKCTVGQPVYIYGYGGTPSTTPLASPPTYSISKIVVSNSGSASPTFAITVNATELLYTGENVTLSGLLNWFAPLNGTQVVLPAGLTTTTFEITSPDGGIAPGNGTYAGGNVQPTGMVTAGPQSNPSIVHLAILGNCPSSGNFSTPGNGALSYVYMSELSTVAAAYTFQPFTYSANNNAWDIGTYGTTQALLGIANAATTAGELYNIQGQGPQSSAYDGEGLLASTLTVNNNGAIPQATIDTLANILAACVDSAPNGSNAGSNGLSAQCSTLFTNATDDGLTTGVQPTDTATAAINIARYPAGNHSSTTGVNNNFVRNIYDITTGDVPFTPHLTAVPNDFTLVINYLYNAAAISVPGLLSNASLGAAESVAVDSTGQIWITAQGGGSAPGTVLWSPFGVRINHVSSSYILGYVSIDGADNAWTGNANSTSGIEEFSSAGNYLGTWGSGYNKAYTVVADDTGVAGNTGSAYFFANTGNTGGNYEMFEYGPLGTTIPGSPFSISPSVITGGDNVAHGAIDSGGNLWITTESSYQIARVSPTGSALFTPIVTAQQPEFPSIDHNGNAWIAVQETNAEIYVVTPSGGTTVLTSGTTHAELTSTFGSAVDGNGNVWFANRAGNYGGVSGVVGTNSIIEINGANQLAISPPTNYIPETEYSGTPTTMTKMLDGSLNLAIDPSGNIWVTNYTGGTVSEIVGAAAPVVTPLSVAAATGKLGLPPSP